MFPHLQPLLPLLRLMVRAERTSLRTTANDIVNAQSGSQRRVQFCGIDCSSTETPVDSVAGSHIPLETNIDALHDVLKEVRNLSMDNGDEGEPTSGIEEVKVCLKNLVHFLTDFESASGKNLREACEQVRKSNHWFFPLRVTSWIRLHILAN